MRVLYNLASVAFDDGRVEETLSWTRRATQRARDLGIEWSFYPAELRHLEVTALYTAGEWDAEPRRGRPPGPGARDGGAHAGRRLLVQVGRGDPAARERLRWAKSLIPRLHEHVLLGLVTAGSEIDLAAWDGDAEAGRRGGRRAAFAAAAAAVGLTTISAWLRLVGTALAPRGRCGRRGPARPRCGGRRAAGCRRGRN